MDPPLQDDPWGNAIVAAVAGGVTAGVRAAATQVALETAGKTVVVETAKGAAKSLGKEAVLKTFDTGGVTMGEPNGPTAAPKESTPPGMSTKTGASAAPKEPNQSVSPPPFRIPEMPRVIQG